MAVAIVVGRGEAAAQRPVSASGAAALLDYRVDAGAGGGVERFSGISGTAAGRIRLLSWLEAGLALELGQLDGSTPGALNRRLAQLAITANVPTGRMVVWQAGVTLRSYGSALGHQRWMLARLGAEARLPFPAGGFEGVVRGAYFPMVESSGLPRPSLAFSGTAGLRYRSGSMSFGLLSSLERYDFPATQGGGGARREQLARLSFELLVDLNRRP